jgi:hypothetical protein
MPRQCEAGKSKRNDRSIRSEVSAPQSASISIQTGGLQGSSATCPMLAPKMQGLISARQERAFQLQNSFGVPVQVGVTDGPCWPEQLGASLRRWGEARASSPKVAMPTGCWKEQSLQPANRAVIAGVLSLSSKCSTGGESLSRLPHASNRPGSSQLKPQQQPVPSWTSTTRL